MKIIRKILLWTLVGLLALGQLQRVELPQYNLAFYYHDILISIWLLISLLQYPIKFKNYLTDFFNKNKNATIFSSIMLISLVLNTSISWDITAIFYTLRLATYISFAFSLSFLIKNKKIDPEYLKFQLFSIGVLGLFLGFIQYTFIKDTRFLSIFGWDDHYARLIGTYFDPGFTGIIFLLTLFIGLSSKYIQNKILQAVIIISFTWGIVLTFSRASYLSLVAGFLIIALSGIKISKQSFQKIFTGTVLFIFLIILAPKPFGEGVDLFRTSTIYARYSAVTQQLKNIDSKTFFIGNGPYSQKNSLSYLSETNNKLIPSHSRVPDNIFINVLLSSGIFGLLFFISFLFNSGKNLKSKNLFIYAGFISLLVHTQFNSSLIQPFILLIFLSGVASLEEV
jgi:hypothetical protein